jgi:predicted permease
MNENLTIMIKLFPVIILISLGVILEKTKFLDKDAINGIKKLAVNITLPCLLFQTFLKADLKPEYLLISLFIFMACVIAFAMGFLFRKLQKSTNQFYPSVFSSFAAGILGYSLFIPVFGTEQLYKLAVIDIGNLLFIFLVLLNFLDSVGCSRTGRKKMGVSGQLKKMLKSPLVIGMVLGILISMLGLSPAFQTNIATSVLVAVTSMLANISIPLILLVLGYELHFDLKHFVAPLSAVLLRIAMMLSFAFLLNYFVIDMLLGLDEMFKMAVYTMFVCSPTILIPAFINEDCADKDFILNFLSIHMIFSIITFMILMTVLR